MLVFITSLLVTGFSFSLAEGEICSICDCTFINITRVEPKPGEFNTFKFKTDSIEPFNHNTTYDSLEKYFYVDCSSEKNVGQIDNLDWPKVKVLGILGNFRNSKWKKLERFPPAIKKQMTILALGQNLITEIEDFELDEFTSLKFLNLTQNRIQIIKKGVFGKLNLLKILDLSINWLTELEDWAFYGTNIKYLNLSHNAITHITPDVFRGLTNLTVLDLSNNRLTKLPDEFGNAFPYLMWLSLSKNSFQGLPELPRDLKRLDVSCNQLRDLHLVHLDLEVLDVRNNELVSLIHTNLPALKVLKAGYNNLTELSSLHSVRIVLLDLSYNKFEKIPQVATSNKLPFLTELYLDGNPILNVTFPAQTVPFSDIRVLSLSRLKLVKKIQRNSFQGMFPTIQFECSKEDGVFIDLSYNSIKFVDEKAFERVPVCRVDLSNNNLKSLSKELLPWKELSYVNLQDNPWQCDCNIQWMLDDFMSFMYEKHPKLLFGMRCSTPLRYRNKMFVSWYGKSENVFCNSGPSTIYLDLGGEKKIEMWTASAITCLLLGCLILITGIIIVVLLCTKPSKKRKRPPSKNNTKGSVYYKNLQNNINDVSGKEIDEKYV